MSSPSDACWICFEPKSRNIVKIDSNSEWPELFEYCIGEQMSFIDTQIYFCGDCIDKLKNFAQFKKSCIKAHSMWTSSEAKTENDDNDEEFYIEQKYSPDEDDINDEREDKNYVSITIIKEEESTTQHQNTKKIEKRKACKKCGRSYEKEKWLIKHEKVCKRKLSATALKKVEQEKGKSNAPYFYCGICEFQSKDSVKVNKHFKEHFVGVSENLKCQLCDFVGRDLADMIYHRYEHHPQQYSHKKLCPECNILGLSRRKLEFHYRSVHLGSIGGWCKCGKKFSIYKSFKRHLCHHSNGLYICDHCKQSFVHRNLITSHLKIHSDVKKYICDACGIGFRKRYDLQSHIYHRHTKLPNVLCTHCNKYFKGGKAFERHLYMLQRENCYVCDVCSKSYPDQSALRSHTILHSEERPYSCDQCGITYKRKSHLTEHLLRHNAAKSHNCPHCGKGFFSAYAMKRHQAVHTGIRQVKCPFCDKTFYDKIQLKSHCNSKHKIECSPSQAK